MSESDLHKALLALENGWKSKRLIYRAVEDNEEDRRWIRDVFHNDSVTFGQAWLDVYKPHSRATSSDLFEPWLKSKLLAVMICLPGSSPDIMSRGDIGRQGTDGIEATEDGEVSLLPTLIPIGAISLTSTTSALQHHRGTKLGIQVAAPYRGKGYGSEAIDWTLDWAFKFAGFHRVTLETHGFNDRAQRLYERLGFVKEGVQREALWFDGRWYDVIVYGMLDYDWKMIKGNSVEEARKL